MKRLLLLPILTLALLLVSCEQTKNPVEPLNADIATVEATPYGQPVPAGIGQGTICNGPMSALSCRSDVVAWVQVLIYLDELTLVSKGTVQWFACTDRSTNLVTSSADCDAGTARWVRSRKADLAVGDCCGPGSSRLTLGVIPEGVTRGFRWVYKAQGSGVQNTEGGPYNLTGVAPPSS